MLNIKELLGREYEVKYQETLFGMNWEALKERRCPLCSNRLKFIKEKFYLCSGRKHGKQFIIKKETFDEICSKLSLKI